ncbi:sugar transferase [Flagellimonas eckloniae]|uniref:Bacterial sugar transferase domain-containing protein n=1 Tax=Flagellimonas eckloniae TaxID=346185 RepID=A0A0Q1DKH1_9FLAO|nr:sugar transferase [Allomuricauda eckloniae]KQC29346.1 hypothetical protein AAY42_05075 [Allomuricauda eckloniae]
MYNPFLKRTLDFLASFIGLVILSPVILFFTFCFWIANKGSAFFIQPRPGKDEKIFNIIKFKTMNDAKDADGNLLPANDRITFFGGFARKFSIDEIPQLINVLIGDMSLIGPRPLRVEYLDLYSPAQKRRHHVRPGISGWAQVNGRNAISWTKKFEYDIEYVDRLSFGFDVKIFFLTIKKILVKDGINSDEGKTMPFFTGSN